MEEFHYFLLFFSFLFSSLSSPRISLHLSPLSNIGRTTTVATTRLPSFLPFSLFLTLSDTIFAVFMPPRRKSTKAAVKRPRSSSSSSSRGGSSGSSYDDDEHDALQRFSNTSAHPRRSRASHRSPPQLSTTPPPSPPRAAERYREREEEGGDAFAPTSREHSFLASASLTREDPPRGELSHHQPPSLLSALLQAEAERAGAAAAAAADYSTTPQHNGLPSPSAVLSPPVAYQLPTPLSLSNFRDEASADVVTIHIGVVPLPGTATCSLPWLRALHAAAAASASSTSSRSAAEAAQRHGDAPCTAETAVDVANLRVLRPRRLPLRSAAASHTSLASRDGTVSPAQGRRGSAEGYSSVASASSSVAATAAGVGEAVIGWSGVFADVPLLLRGAQSGKVPAATEKVVDGADGSDDVAADAQVCRAAATVMLLLA